MGWFLRHAESIAVAFFVAAFAWVLHDWRTMHLEEAHRKDVAAKEAAVRKACQKAQTINKDTENAYNARIDALRDQLAAVKRLPNPSCVPIIRTPACPNQAPGGPELRDGYAGVTRGGLYDFAGRAEEVGIAFDELQVWVSKHRCEPRV